MCIRYKFENFSIPFDSQNEQQSVKNLKAIRLTEYKHLNIIFYLLCDIFSHAFNLSIYLKKYNSHISYLISHYGPFGIGLI